MILTNQQKKICFEQKYYLFLSVCEYLSVCEHFKGSDDNQNCKQLLKMFEVYFNMIDSPKRKQQRPDGNQKK